MNDIARWLGTSADIMAESKQDPWRHCRWFRPFIKRTRPPTATMMWANAGGGQTLGERCNSQSGRHPNEWSGVATMMFTILPHHTHEILPPLALVLLIWAMTRCNLCRKHHCTFRHEL